MLPMARRRMVRSPRRVWERYASPVAFTASISAWFRRSRSSAEHPGNRARKQTTESGVGAVTSNAGSARDRKSTRLNSSHLGISYAVFCLKKKKKNTQKRQYKRKKQEN